MVYAKHTEKKDRKGKRSTGQYMTRSHAIKKLQVTLQDFRKLCILKGIYPRDPKKKLAGKNKTYYLTKDIAFLMHDPLLEKFRQKKALRKKIKRAKGRNEPDAVKRLQQNHPLMKLDHIIKERYPTFNDALRDMDDALCMIHLFARMPKNKKVQKKKIKRCARLCTEFQNFVIMTHALRKVFVSVKGMYYQARIRGQNITWLVPHHFTSQLNPDIDLRIMVTFLEFYTTLAGFTLFRLFNHLGLHYPPIFDGRLSNAGETLSALVFEPIAKPAVEASAAKPKAKASKEAPKTLDKKLTQKLKKAAGDEQQQEKDKEKEKEESEEESEDEEDEEKEEKELRLLTSELQLGSEFDHKYAQLFRGLHFFLGREAPRDSLEFVIRAFGGRVSWDGSLDGLTEGHSSITHSVSDRPILSHKFLNREYIQPQWVFDSVNVCALLPTHEYAPGVELPPHLSPFVDNEAVGYTPERVAQINAMLGKKTPGVGKSSLPLVVAPPVEGEDEEMESEDESEEEKEDEKEKEEEEGATGKTVKKAAKESAKKATPAKATPTKGQKRKAETPLAPVAAASTSTKGKRGRKQPVARPNKRPKTKEQIEAEAEENALAEQERQYREELAQETGSVAPTLPRAPKDLRDDYDERTYASLVLSNKKKRLYNAIERRDRAKGRKLNRLKERKRIIDDAKQKKAGKAE